MAADGGEVGRFTDKYFTKTRAIVERFGDVRVTYAVFMRRPVLATPRLAVDWLQAVAASRGAAVEVELVHAEGAWVGAGEPMLYIHGPFRHLVDLETVFLQKLGPACVAAYNAYTMCTDLPYAGFLAMDARHCAGAEMAEMMAYAASVGSARAQRETGAVGFIGNATDATAHFFGQPKGLGTMPHALIGYAGSTLRAAEMFHECFPEQDLTVLVELATEEADAASLAEAEAELSSLQHAVESLEVRTLLSGEYDPREALVTIRSEAGGVDAADFAAMLLRMYLRWAERHGYPAEVYDTSYAEEAGIKSATFQVKAPYAYGTLSVEQGTHRLVRISPFDNQGRRQTSFAGVEVAPVVETSDHVDVDEKDLRVDVYRSSGPGGQGVNTTDSAVRITHLPTGIVVSCQNERSQIQNKASAMAVLQSKLLERRRQEERAVMDALKDTGNSWGNQMRSYVLHPYQMVKDLRTNFEVGNPSAVFDGEIDDFIEAGIRWRRSTEAEAASA